MKAQAYIYISALLVGATVHAQDSEPFAADDPFVSSEDTNAPTSEPAAPVPMRTRPARQPRSTGAVAAGGSSNANLPTANGVGLGIGYVFPTAIDTINTASARFRLGKWTLEPRFELSFDRDKTEIGGSDATDRMFDVLVETTARYPIATAGNLELVVLGGVSIGYNKDNPEGDDNDDTTTTLALLWGIGIDYWLTGRWAVSMTASNPLFSVSSLSEEQIGGGSVDTSNVDGGLIFDPTISLLTHLYFF